MSITIETTNVDKINHKFEKNVAAMWATDREEIKQLRAVLTQTAQALRLLHDYQNGCPLHSYEKHWNEAMRLTQAALALAEPLVGKGGKT